MMRSFVRACLFGRALFMRRYQAHHSSQQIAEKQQDATERRMVELQESSAGSAWIDVQFLKTAMEQLIECRRVLK